MKHILILLLNLTMALPVFADDTGNSICIRLEGISIGCVPSTDHPCFRNRNPEAMGTAGGTCTYFPEGAFGPAPASDAFFDKTIAAQAGPIAWRCQTWEPGGDCPPGGDVTTCPGARCRVFQNPVCATKCTWCIKDTKQERAPSAGCIVCTRPYCADEPPASPYCPLHPIKNGAPDLTYSLPQNGLPKCPSQMPPPAQCPATMAPPQSGATCPVMAPNGECVVQTSPGEDCGPRPPIRKVEQVTIPRSCPWIADERSYTPEVPGPPRIPAVNHCEPVREGNRFPQDCPGGPPCPGA